MYFARGDTAVFAIVRSIENSVGNLIFPINFEIFQFSTEFSIDLTKTKIGSFEVRSGCSPVKELIVFQNTTSSDLLK